MKKRILGIVSLFLAIGSVPAISSAHPTSSSCSAGGELYGYWVDCSNHQADNSFTWNTAIPNTTVAVDYPYRAAMTSGTSKWNATGKVSISNTSTSSTNGNIYTYSDPNVDTLAAFHDYYSDTRGHLYAWKIIFNKAKLASVNSASKAAVAAHEIGHAIGMNDLYLDGNKAKLMYGYFSFDSNGATTHTPSPVATDITGAVEATKS